MSDYSESTFDLDATDARVRSSGLGTGCLTRLGSALCLGLLVVYGILWSGLVQKSGGAENYVRSHDFLAILTGATVVAGQHPALLYDRATQDAAQALVLRPDLTGMPWQPYLTPPFAAILLAPLLRADLNYSILFTAWAVLTTGAAGLSIGMLAGRWPAARGTPWLLMLAATSFLPLISSLMLGQETMFALLGWIGLTVGLKAGRDGAAGAAGALAVLQPLTFPLLLGVLLIRRRWRALGSLLATLALGALAAVPLLGVDWPLHYAAFLRVATTIPAGGIMLAVLVLGGLLAGIWWRDGGPADRPAWDLRWALTLLALLPPALLLDGNSLILAIVPGWILATTVAGTSLPPGQRWFWAAWLLLGYALVPASTLLSPVFTLLGAGWIAGAVWGLAWSLRHGAGTDAPPSTPTADEAAENLLEPTGG